MINDSATQRDMVERLAEAFMLSYRAGECKSVDEYAQQFPELADELRELLAALVILERNAPHGDAIGRASEVSNQAARSPREIGDFVVIREIARGGMGVVYEAVQQSLGRHVALKVLSSPGLLNPSHLERFRFEARAAARLHHSNIVPVFGVGEQEGLHYYAMQFIQGQSLDLVISALRELQGKRTTDKTVHARDTRTYAAASRLHSEQFNFTANRLIDPLLAPHANSAPDGPAAEPPAAAPSVSTDASLPAHVKLSSTQSGREFYHSVARIGLQVAEALAYAHSEGVLHRDIKPSNLLLDAKGNVWITDFGLAKAEGTEGLTHAGDFVGTLRYMAPERLDGSSDRRSDLYSLGATLYELLTLQPFLETGSSGQLIERIRNESPSAPSKLDRSIPRDLETIVLKALAKDLASRYRTAAAMADDLRRFLKGEPIHARPIGRAERAWRWSRRNPVPAILTAAVLLVLCAGFAGVTWNYWQAETARAALERNLYFHRIALAHREILADNLGEAHRLLAACPQQLRDWEWHYLQRLSKVDPITVERPRQPIFSLAFSHDGRQIASAQEDGRIGLYSLEPEKVEFLPGHKVHAFSVVFHPHKKYLASAGADGKIKLWDLQTRQMIFEKSGHAGKLVGLANALAFSPDGRRLAGPSGSETVTVWSVPEGRALLSLPRHTQLVSAVAFSPGDGHLLATGDHGCNMRIYDAHSKKLLRELPGHTGPISGIAFSRDGRFLATASFDRTAKIWEVVTGREVATLRGHSGIVAGLVFSRDGRRLATVGGDDKTVKLWDSKSAIQVLNLRGGADFGECVAISPDGLRLASSGRDGTIRIWDATPLEGSEGLEFLTLNHDAEVWSATYSPDGKRIASASWDHMARVWDADSGRLVSKLHHPAAVFHVEFNPHQPDQLATSLRTYLPMNSAIYIWNLSSQLGALHEYELRIPDKENPHCVTFSPDGRYLLKGSIENQIHVWDKSNQKWLGAFGQHAYEIRAVKFSPDGTRVASASRDGAVKVWNWNPQELTLPSTAPQQPLLELDVKSTGYADRIAFSADGRRLATAGKNRSVQVWDALSGTRLFSLDGHTGDVYAVAFSRDGSLLATGGEDTTVRLWDAAIEPYRPIEKLRGHFGIIISLAFSPDSRRLASGSRDETVRIWDLPTRQLDQ